MLSLPYVTFRLGMDDVITHCQWLTVLDYRSLCHCNIIIQKAPQQREQEKQSQPQQCCHHLS